MGYLASQQNKMKKTIKHNEKKNSNLVVKEKQTPKTNITSESTVIVSFYERGALKTPNYSNNPKARTEYHEVILKTKMTSDAVQYFISEDGNPDIKKYGRTPWKNMGKEARLKANLEYIADGRKFEYIIVN